MSEAQGEAMHDRKPASAWRESLRLAVHFRDQRWAAPVMLLLGAGAAIAETTGISFAVMFLFTLLGQTERLTAGEGLLADAFRWVGGVFGSDSFFIAAQFFRLISSMRSSSTPTR